MGIRKYSKTFKNIQKLYRNIRKLSGNIQKLSGNIQKFCTHMRIWLKFFVGHEDTKTRRKLTTDG